jgi:uncharacterized protein (DUF1778 family)
MRKQPDKKEDSQQTVVFALRLTAEQRDLIHEAAQTTLGGRGKATQFALKALVDAAEKALKR